MTAATPHPSRRPRGRPRKQEASYPVYVRIPMSAYDAYCRRAGRLGETSVSKLIRAAIIRAIRATP